MHNMEANQNPALVSPTTTTTSTTTATTHQSESSIVSPTTTTSTHPNTSLQNKRMLVHSLFLIVHTVLIILLLLTTSFGRHIKASYSYYYDADPPVTNVPYSDSKLTYRPFSMNDRLLYKARAMAMFYHGYDSYMKYAYPLDELNPIDCTGRGPDTEHPDNININDVLGNYSLSLVDSLDMLAILGNITEFQHAVKLVISHLSFTHNVTVQVFEASIRILGSLLSSHLLIIDPDRDFGDIAPFGYANELLYLSTELADRLLQAFHNSSTGIPYPRVNLNYNNLSYTDNTTCTAGAGTLLLEFGILSRLLHDPIYESLARNALNVLVSRKSSKTGLVGNTINVESLVWTDTMTGLGAGIDSLYEYLYKSYILFGNKEDLHMFNQLYTNIMKYMKKGRACDVWRSELEHTPLYTNVDMHTGRVINTWIDALTASFPALQVLYGDIDESICLHAFYYSIWRKYDMLPERFDWQKSIPISAFFPLRPEFVESTYMLYQATQNPFYLHVGKDIIDSLEKYAKTKCGYATIHDVVSKTLEDRMESFFLSETTKYLYLLFDEDNVLNTNADRYIFTTEGHIIKLSQLLRNGICVNNNNNNNHNHNINHILNNNHNHNLHHNHNHNTKKINNTNDEVIFHNECYFKKSNPFQLPLSRKALGQIEAFVRLTEN